MLKALMVFLILLIVWLFYRSLKKRSLWKNAAIPRQQTIASQPRRPLPSGPRKLPQGCASWPAETRDDARQISDLAQRIWSEAFRPFLPEEQINYMLRKFQSWIAIQSQFSAGVSYRFILNRTRDLVSPVIMPGRQREAGSMSASSFCCRSCEAGALAGRSWRKWRRRQKALGSKVSTFW